MNTDVGSSPISSVTTRPRVALNQVLMFALFFVLYFADTLKLNLSLAPGLSVKNAFLYLMLLSFAIETAVTRQRKVELASVFAPFFLFVAYAFFMWLVALLVLDYPGYGLRSSMFALKSGPIDDLIVLLVFAFGVSSSKQALWVLRGMLWVVIVGNAITVVEGLEILNFGLIGAKEDGRVLGPVGNANQFAYLLAVFIPVMIAMFKSEVGIKRFLAGAGVLVSFVAIVMAASRGGIVAILSGCVIAAFLLRSVVSLGVLVRVAGGLFVVGVVALAAASMGDYLDLLTQRFGQFGVGGHEASSGRTMIWTRLIVRMLEDPITFITGFGWHAYQTFKAYNEFGFSPHSTYLVILFNLGLIGVFCFAMILVNVLRAAVNAATTAPPELRHWLIAFVVGFAGLAVGLIFNELNAASIYIWSLAGVCLRIVAEVQGDQSSAVRAG